MQRHQTRCQRWLVNQRLGARLRDKKAGKQRMNLLDRSSKVIGQRKHLAVATTFYFCERFVALAIIARQMNWDVLLWSCTGIGELHNSCRIVASQWIRNQDSTITIRYGQCNVPESVKASAESNIPQNKPDTWGPKTFSSLFSVRI